MLVSSQNSIQTSTTEPSVMDPKTNTEKELSIQTKFNIGPTNTQSSTSTTVSNSIASTLAHTNRSNQTITPRIPIYYLSKGNNSQLIEKVLSELGWKRTTDRYADFHLRWTESIHQINYGTFREAEQLVNHIPNCGLLTNKLGLLLSLRDFEKRYLNQHNRPPAISMNEFLPTTFIVDDKKERESFFQAHEEDVSQVWICKPVGSNQGRGIFMIWDLNLFKQYLEKRDREALSSQSGIYPRLIQKYITKPLLLDGCKFDIRCYMLIASTLPYLVLYHPGYIRRSTKPYSLHDTNLVTHLTNQFMQKKDPDYLEVKNDTVWDLDQFNDYVNEHYQETKNIPKDWVKSTLQWRIQRIIYQVFSCVKNRLASRVGFFELFGLDFMIDEDMRVWLLEINTNPALQTHCTVLQKVVPDVIKSTLHTCIECFEKTRMQKQILPFCGIGMESNTYMSYNRHRNYRISLDETFTSNKVSGNLGLPEGWSLIYNESPTSLRTRWYIAQSYSLHSWIVPRYRPSISQTSSSDSNVNQNPIQTGAKEHDNSKLITSAGSTSPNQDLSIDPSDSAKQCQNLAAHKQRHSVPKFRAFEQSLRRYPIVSRTNPQRVKIASVTKPDKVLENTHRADPLIALPLPNSFRCKILNKSNRAKEENPLEHLRCDYSSKQRPSITRSEHLLRHREPVRVTTIHLISGQPNSMTGMISRPPTLPFSFVSAQLHTNPTSRESQSSVSLKDFSTPILSQWPGPLLPPSTKKPKSSDYIDRLKRFRRSSATDSGS